MLSVSVAIGLWRNRARTEETDRHNAGESDGRVVDSVNGQTLIHLKRATNVKRRYDQDAGRSSPRGHQLTSYPT